MTLYFSRGVIARGRTSSRHCVTVGNRRSAFDEAVTTVRLLCAIYDAVRTDRVVRPAALS